MQKNNKYIRRFLSGPGSHCRRLHGQEKCPNSTHRTCLIENRTSPPAQRYFRAKLSIPLMAWLWLLLPEIDLVTPAVTILTKVNPKRSLLLALPIWHRSVWLAEPRSHINLPFPHFQKEGLWNKFRVSVFIAGVGYCLLSYLIETPPDIGRPWDVG